jgi:hypothetical protein
LLLLLWLPAVKKKKRLHLHPLLWKHLLLHPLLPLHQHLLLTHLHLLHQPLLRLLPLLLTFLLQPLLKLQRSNSSACHEKSRLRAAFFMGV